MHSAVRPSASLGDELRPALGAAFPPLPRPSFLQPSLSGTSGPSPWVQPNAAQPYVPQMIAAVPRAAASTLSGRAPWAPVHLAPAFVPPLPPGPAPEGGASATPALLSWYAGHCSDAARSDGVKAEGLSVAALESCQEESPGTLGRDVPVSGASQANGNAAKRSKADSGGGGGSGGSGKVPFRGRKSQPAEGGRAEGAAAAERGAARALQKRAHDAALEAVKKLLRPLFRVRRIDAAVYKAVASTATRVLFDDWLEHDGRGATLGAGSLVGYLEEAYDHTTVKVVVGEALHEQGVELDEAELSP